MDLCPVDLERVNPPGVLRTAFTRSTTFDGLPELVRRRLPRSADVVQCPQGHPIPAEVYERPNLVIPVVGVSRGSKSHFVLSLWHSLVRRNDLSPWAAGFMPNDAVAAEQTTGDKAASQSIGDKVDLLFRDGQGTSQTTPIKDLPLVRYLQPFFLTSSDLSLTMFDVAGDDFTRESYVDATEWGPGLMMADALIVMLDGEAVVRGQVDSTAQFLKSLVRTLRKERGLSPRYRLDIPVAILIGKADIDSLEGGPLPRHAASLERLAELREEAIKVDSELFPVGEEFVRGDGHLVRDMLRKGMEARSAKVVDYLAYQDHKGLVEATLESFNPARMLFWPVSATGKRPMSAGSFDFELPIEPFGGAAVGLWLLYHLGATSL